MAIKLEEIVVDQSTGNFNNTPNAAGVTSPVYAQSATDVADKIRTFTRRNTKSNSLIFPEESIKYFIELKYSQYRRFSGQQQGGSYTYNVGFERVGSVYLPLPAAGMVDTHDVDYQEEALGSLIGGGATLAQGLSEADTVQDYISGLAGGLAGTAGNVAAGIPQAGAAAQAAFGFAPNKFMTILLKGPRYKRHEFTWKLYPSSPAESTTINQIIVLLNNAMAPGLKASKLLFDFPYVFHMQYQPNPRFLYKLKPMVLESLSTNYVPPGVPSFYSTSKFGENPPECIEIRARFLELEYWLRNQFDDTQNADFNHNYRQTNQAGGPLRNDRGANVQEAAKSPGEQLPAQNRPNPGTTLPGQDTDSPTDDTFNPRGGA